MTEKQFMCCVYVTTTVVFGSLFLVLLHEYLKIALRWRGLL